MLTLQVTKLPLFLLRLSPTTIIERMAKHFSRLDYNMTIKMNNPTSKLFVLLLFFLAALTASASSESKYSPLIRSVRGQSSKQVLHKGDSLLKVGQEDKALVMYMLVCSRTTDRMTDEEMADCALANLKAGDIYYGRGNYINALESYQAGLRLSEGSSSKAHLALLYNNIGKVYCVFKDYDKGLEYFKKGFCIRPKGDKSLSFKLLANLFGVCIDRGDLSAARKYRQLMLTTPRPHTDINQFMLGFSKALLASKEARHAQAIRVLDGLASFSVRAKLPVTYLCSAYEELYGNYIALGDRVNAVKYARLCMDTAEANHLMHYFPDAIRTLGSLYKREGNTALGQRYDAQYLNLVDSIYNAKRFNVVKNQQFMYEVDKANKEITRLHQEEETHRRTARLYQLLFLVSVLAVAFISILLFFVLRQKRRLEESYRKLYDINRRRTEEEELRTAKKQEAASCLKDEQRQRLLDSIRRVMEESDDFCQQNFTVTTLAKLVGSNGRYVSIVINDHYGKSFTDLVNEYRVKKACERLEENARSGQFTIAAIGHSVGYKASSTFIAQFRKYTGLTPSVYQKFATEDHRMEKKQE